MIFNAERRQPVIGLLRFAQYGRVAALGSGCAAEPKASRRRGLIALDFGAFSRS
jgi:hypothetical protein